MIETQNSGVWKVRLQKRNGQIHDEDIRSIANVYPDVFIYQGVAYLPAGFAVTMIAFEKRLLYIEAFACFLGEEE